MEEASKQVLRALRGKRSQAAFARRLGYRAPSIANWEAGRRFPTASGFLRACKRVRIDVAAAFDRFHPASAPEIGSADAAAVARWLDVIRGTTGICELAARADRSRFALGRWLASKTEPRLPDFLRVVEAATGRASDLVAALVPIEEVPALLAEHERRQRARRLAFEHPWTEAVLRVFETEAYQRLPAHDGVFVARALRLSQPTADGCIDALLDAGLVRWDGPRLRDTGPMNVDTRRREEDVNRLRRHWASVAVDRMDDPGPEDAFGYNVCSLSEASYRQVRELIRRTYREVRSIAAAPQPLQAVALMNLSLIEWPVPGRGPNGR